MRFRSKISHVKIDFVRKSYVKVLQRAKTAFKMGDLTQQQMKLIGDLEIEMMADMYNRMTAACQKKCVPPRYKEGELSKGESVCIDRCVAKYLDIHDRIGKKLTAMTQQDQANMQTMQQVPQAPGAMPK